MAAGIAEAASIIAVIQISDRVLSLCSEYASAIKNAKRDIERLANEVKAFLDVLKRVEKMAKGLDASKLLASEPVSKAIEECSSELSGLIVRLDPGTGRRTMSRVGVRALKWPFTRKDLNKIIESLERHKGIINMALHVDQM
ncbi:hypothetical protein GP486_004023 [Trichoglossum hirsutum]|uniref:Azaphilone pigments biosynthesis cluster protein L N-terminal domain-containing protein n=1 Tax=Trichoglossum hirsutum TaxID=265104 RepID=A0A9P8LC06_9PEZI|nr:hypothetical protein GP486_004023 [Trichoglossum hirsutum]